MEWKRGDGRDAGTQLRQIKSEQSLINRADGSARVSQGFTSVLVAVYGPIEVGSREEKLDAATILVSFKSPKGNEKEEEKEKCVLLQRSLAGVIISALHPRTSIDIQVQVLRDDGGLLAVAVNAVCMALVDAGIPMNHLIAGVSSCFVPGKGLLYDPTREEELLSSSTFHFAFSSSSMKTIMIQADGDFEEEVLFQAQQASQRAGGVVVGYLKGAVKGHGKYSFLQ